MKISDYGIFFKYFDCGDDDGIWIREMTFDTTCCFLDHPDRMLNLFIDGVPIFTLTSGFQIINLYLSLVDGGMIVHTIPRDYEIISRDLRGFIPEDLLAQIGWK